MKNKLFFGVFAAMLIVAPFSASAGTFQAEENYQLNPGISIEDNLYAAGGTVNVAGKVNGDLLAVGGTVIVSGPVSGDAMLAGGTLNLSGNVSGDMRIAGGTLIVLNTVAGEFVAAGGQVSVMPGTSVGKDATIAGGTIQYAGSVSRNLKVDGNKVYINGPVGGDVSITAQEIKFGPNAVIQGNLDYYSSSEAIMEQGAAINGVVNFHKTEMPAKKAVEKGVLLGFLTVAWLLKSLMMLTAALVALYFVRSQTTAVIKDAGSNFWKEMGRGFVVLVVIPIAIIISLVTVIGIPLGVIALLFYGIMLLVSAIIAPLLFARLAIDHIFKKGGKELNWWIAIIAIVVFGLIGFIPIVGWIFGFLIFLASFGAVTNHIYKKLK